MIVLLFNSVGFGDSSSAGEVLSHRGGGPNFLRGEEVGKTVGKKKNNQFCLKKNLVQNGSCIILFFIYFLKKYSWIISN
jgi:hypothetical protein